MSITPFTIQRGGFKKVSTFDGIDSLLSFEYMGSAEFEYGGLPASLKKMCGNLENISIHPSGLFQKSNVNSSKVANQEFFIIATVDVVQDIVDFLTKAKDGQVRTQEWTNLDHAFKGERDTEFWWDIENHWMGCFGMERAKQVVLALQMVKQKKGW